MDLKDSFGDELAFRGIFFLISTANVFLPGGCGTTIRHNTQIYISHKITHHAQTMHSTISYTNNNEHVTQNEQNAKKKIIKTKCLKMKKVPKYCPIWGKF
jgi:hypothetical protein